MRRCDYFFLQEKHDRRTLDETCMHIITFFSLLKREEEEKTAGGGNQRKYIITHGTKKEKGNKDRGIVMHCGSAARDRIRGEGRRTLH